MEQHRGGSSQETADRAVATSRGCWEPWSQITLSQPPSLALFCCSVGVPAKASQFSPGYLCFSCACCLPLISSLPCSPAALHTHSFLATREYTGGGGERASTYFENPCLAVFQSQGWEEMEGGIREKKLEDCCWSNGETAHHRLWL